MKTDKCSTCNKAYSVSCDYNQGRCPMHPPYFPDFPEYHLRYLNLGQSIKNLWNKLWKKWELQNFAEDVI